MTSVSNITFEQVYNRLIAQLPPWFGNQQFVPPPAPSTFTPTTNFNNVLWGFLVTAFNAYLQMQYDFLQLRIGQYEISNDLNWPINIPTNFPFTVSPSFAYATINPSAVSVQLVLSGFNYAVNDQIMIRSGVFNAATILQVKTVFGGLITGVTILNPGNYAVAPVNPVSQLSTTGNGSGALFNIKYAPNFPTYPIAFSNNLDLISQDFFGGLLPRRPQELDDSFRSRILSTVMKPKATRPAMLQALTNLVQPAFIQAGVPFVAPEIYEPWYPADNGGYNDYQALAFGTAGGFNGIGAYGTGSNPYTCTIYVFLPQANGLGGHPGYLTQGESITWGAGLGDPSITPATPAVDIPPQWYGTYDQLNTYITLQDILNVINLTKVLGTVCHLIVIYLND